MSSRPAIEFPGEPKSNAIRASLTQGEPISLRTFTPTQVVISKSAGCSTGPATDEDSTTSHPVCWSRTWA